MFKRTLKFDRALAFSAIAGLAILATGCGANNNNLGTTLPGGPGGQFGFGTSCFSPYSSTLNVGFNAPQVSLTTTNLSLSGQASGAGLTQGQFVKQFYGGTLYVNLQGLPQYQGVPTGPISANGSLNVSGSLVDTWKYQLGLTFNPGWSGGGVNPGFQTNLCVQTINMNLVVNPTITNPQVYSGVVQLQLSTGQSLPPFLI